MLLQTFCYIKDLSYNKENVPIPAVNALRRDYPDYVEYSNQRIPAQGVSLNLDEEFLVGCDCTDGCRVIVHAWCYEKLKVVPYLGFRTPELIPVLSR